MHEVKQQEQQRDYEQHVEEEVSPNLGEKRLIFQVDEGHNRSR